MHFQLFKWTDTPPNESGIYGILYEGKIYVGQCQNFRLRWNNHKSGLRRNKRANPHLQNTFNKHNAEDFEFIILEYLDIKDLTSGEQRWGDLFQSHNPDFGFNCGEFLDSPARGRKQSQEQVNKSLIAREPSFEYWRKEVTVVYYTGEIFKIKGIKKFCRENKINTASFNRMLQGKQSGYAGYVLYNDGQYTLQPPLSVGLCYHPEERAAKMSKLLKGKPQRKIDCSWNFIEFISPEGKFYLTDSVLALEFRLDLKNSVLESLWTWVSKRGIFNLNGERYTNNGWSVYKIHYKSPELVPSIRQEIYDRSKWEELWLENGNQIEQVTNVRRFADEKSISAPCLLKVINGQMKRGEYMGWRVAYIKYKPEYAHLNNSHSSN